MGVESWLKGWVSRGLPQAETDNDPGIMRLGRYGDVYMIGAVRKQHALADEGSYFVANNGQTGIVGPLSPTAYSDINPGVVAIVSNSDSAGNLNGKRIHLDFMHLVVTVAGAAASGLTNLLFAWAIDNTDRYSSGGTDLAANIYSPNMDVSKSSSVARVRFGAITPSAASGSRRIVVGQRQLRQLNSATAMGVAQDHMLMNFGGVEPTLGAQIDLTTAKTTAGSFQYPLPPITVGPGQCALLHMWSPGAALTTGVTFLPEFAWWER